MQVRKLSLAKHMLDLYGVHILDIANLVQVPFSLSQIFQNWAFFAAIKIREEWRAMEGKWTKSHRSHKFWRCSTAAFVNCCESCPQIVSDTSVAKSFQRSMKSSEMLGISCRQDTNSIVDNLASHCSADVVEIEELDE